MVGAAVFLPGGSTIGGAALTTDELDPLIHVPTRLKIDCRAG
jgi:hypothetical protein